MRLSDYLDESFVVVDLKSAGKEDAIRELAEVLRASANVTDFDKYLAGVFEREAQASTGVGRGAAIPHARTDALKDFVVAVGRAAGGIDFDAVDGQPVNIIVLMGTPVAKVRSYLKVLAHISHLIKKEGFLASLLSAPDAKAIVEAFRANERPVGQ